MQTTLSSKRKRAHISYAESQEELARGAQSEDDIEYESRKVSRVSPLMRYV